MKFEIKNKPYQAFKFSDSTHTYKVRVNKFSLASSERFKMVSYEIRLLFGPEVGERNYPAISKPSSTSQFYSSDRH